MKQFHFLFLFTAIILIFCVVLPVSGQSGGFVIDGADATNTLNTESSATLSSLLDQTAPRFVLEFANANAFLSLVNPPGQLDGLLNSLYPRIIFQYANANRYLEYDYPRDLIGDTTPPQIQNIKVSKSGEKAALISWTTNEYANSTVKCGTSSGVYTISKSNPLYLMQHSTLITGLSPGVEYFCRISCTDQSGNTRVSNEFSFIQSKMLFFYLPLIQK